MEPTVEVTLYTRRDCPLCDEVKAAMRASGADVSITEIDIDNDPELRRRYSDDVPVVCIGNAELFRHRVEPAEFARLVRERRRAMPSPLADEKCIPCKGGVPPMKGPELNGMVAELGGGWRVAEGHHLEKEFRFPDFAQALSFTNAVGAIAEREGHHPDIYLAWGKVRLEIWTHKVNGLTRGDFVLAAKIDAALA